MVVALELEGIKKNCESLCSFLEIKEKDSAKLTDSPRRPLEMDRQRLLDEIPPTELSFSLLHSLRNGDEFACKVDHVESDSNNPLSSFKELSFESEEEMLRLSPEIKLPIISDSTTWQIFWNLGPCPSADTILEIHSNLFGDPPLGGESIFSPRRLSFSLLHSSRNGDEFACKLDHVESDSNNQLSNFEELNFESEGELQLSPQIKLPVVSDSTTSAVFWNLEPCPSADTILEIHSNLFGCSWASH